jgi:ribosomal-protein-alanine N-acetyltransferase
MPVQYHLKQFQPSDWEQFKAIRLEALQSEPGVFCSSYQQEAERADDHWQQRLANTDCAYFGLYNESDLIGMTGIMPYTEEGQAELIASYIQTAHRGKGLSALLYKTRIDWAKSKGLKTLIVSHRESNLASQSANRQFGFVYTYTEPRVWHDGAEEDNLYYMLPLLSNNTNLHIETPRLYIRQLLPTDEQGMFELDSDKEVHKYVGQHPVTTIEESREVIGIIRQQYEQYGIGRWAVLKKDTDEFIGWTGYKFMKGPLNNHSSFYDFGYRFKSAHWRQGYATESALAALKYGIEVLGLKDIYAMTDIDNIGSRKTLEKVGFSYIETFNYDDHAHPWRTNAEPTTWYKLIRKD